MYKYSFSFVIINMFILLCVHLINAYCNFVNCLSSLSRNIPLLTMHGMVNTLSVATLKQNVDNQVFYQYFPEPGHTHMMF